MRLLFCLPTTSLSGGVKVVFELANRSADDGESVDIFSFAASPRWYMLRAPLLPTSDLHAVDLSSYDFVLVSNAFLLPTVLPLAGSARVIFFCQDYETFHHAAGPRYEDFMAESETIAALYRLPAPIITVSRAVQGLIRDRIGKDSIYVPAGIDKTIFFARPPHPMTPPARVLFVGNYLMPYKGMKDGLAALAQLSSEMPVQLVLVTQEHRGRQLLDGLPFPVEIHYCPTDGQIPDIMATCDVYCCTSWYEGLGLPALEAFACGLPVVSTRTLGVSEYGVDGVNLLLARPNDPTDLHAALARLLRDADLRDRLRRGGFETVCHRYDWDESMQHFRRALAEIDRTHRGASAVDAAAMAGLLADLEAEGGLTPIAIFREFETLAAELDTVLGALAEDDRRSDLWFQRLGALRDAFGRRTENRCAQYYDAFKCKYDVCRLVLALAGSDRIGEAISRLLHPYHAHDKRVGVSFSEIRYRE